MQIIDKIYIDGAFVKPHGDELFNLFNPATEQVIGRVLLADAQDARDAIAAAKRAFPAFSRTGKSERIEMLRRMHSAVVAKEDELLRGDHRRIRRAGVAWPMDGPAREQCATRSGEGVRGLRIHAPRRLSRGGDAAAWRRRTHYALE